MYVCVTRSLLSPVGFPPKHQRFASAHSSHSTLNWSFYESSVSCWLIGNQSAAEAELETPGVSLTSRLALSSCSGTLKCVCFRLVRRQEICSLRKLCNPQMQLIIPSVCVCVCGCARVS